MIVRSKRSQSRLRGQEHRHFQVKIDDLQTENRSLRLELLQLQQRLLEAQSAKKKYKAKYRDTKQKLEIINMIRPYRQHNPNDPYELCASPKTKNTRIRTISEEEFQSLRAGMGVSELASQGTRMEEVEGYSSKRCVTAASTMKQIEGQTRSDENTRILDHLLQLQQQLQTISQRIQSRKDTQSRVVQLQDQLYHKMEEVVDKVAKMEVRDLQRETRRANHQRQKSAKRFNSSMKAVERIGRDLLGFKIQQKE